MIYNAIRNRKGLIHGRLDGNLGEHCALGSYFSTNRKCSLPNSIIDEVAAVNDMTPRATTRIRKLRVMKWLRWKLKGFGLKP